MKFDSKKNAEIDTPNILQLVRDTFSLSHHCVDQKTVSNKRRE